MLVCDYVLTMKFLSTKITINFWAVVLLASCLNAAVVVETRDEQVQNTSQTLLRLRAFNGTGDTLRNVEFRYFLAAKPSPAVLEKYYLPGADATIDSSSSTGAVVKISVPIFAPGVFPDSGGLSLGLHFPDWSDLRKPKRWRFMWRGSSCRESCRELFRMRNRFRLGMESVCRFRREKRYISLGARSMGPKAIG